MTIDNSINVPACQEEFIAETSSYSGFIIFITTITSV